MKECQKTGDVTASRTSKGAALLIASMSSFLAPFMSSSVNIALPSIGKQ
jgi:hypothetical protein